MLNEKRKEELTTLCQRLVKEQSYSGNEKSVADIIQDFAHSKLFDSVIKDKYGNVILVINGNSDGPKVLFDGHIDTVPVNEDKWNVDPFSGEINNGKIYGRGTSDMKGAVSAMVAAACYFAEDTNKQFPGTIYVSCSVHEECFEGVATREVSEQVKPDYVVIGEATDLNLNRGQRGRAEIVLETFGKSAHSSNPEKGVNAVNKMNGLLLKIQQLKVAEHPILGKGILELTDIKSAPYPGASVVPSHCKVTFDRRLLVNETKESVLAPIESLIKEMKKTDPELKATVSYAYGEEKCYTGEKIGGERFFPAWLFNEKEAFVEAALDSLLQQGIDSKISHYSFCTNGSHFAGENGIKTVGFGPSQEHMAHIDNEYIEIQQLQQATVGYYSLMQAFTHLKKEQKQTGRREYV
ncbi:YgeY family selenium metabolism-linked hydrolase [Fictibacillus phosphorivorans]|uniref:YgeY family selenium metabolism-linked hydrolase n=1 Tax=Fictibacillus phosphorivorans TaxID=1221500 RepID=UPI00203C7AE6|nr:YgeY family selenium metabolism-linked hydrolase [Fictibacillus phosphorivorans]MCM3718556.1 YgeY family selenium metabolism-linked hydrolase [Fictibacillus phosphorivorans]MCM3776088.1 YgeY family selenium metabolism-linked hydrolase [Fictibacillus phosphorivorans]